MRTIAQKDVAQSKLVSTSNAEGKTPLIIDTTGSLQTYFRYAGQVCDVSRLVIGNAMGGNADIGDEMRQSYVSGAKYGKDVVYIFGKAFPSKWATYLEGGDSGTPAFDPKICWNPALFKQRDFFAKQVTDSEDIDELGNKEIWPSDSLTVCLLVEAESGKENEMVEAARTTFGEEIFKLIEPVLVQ